MVAVQSYVLSRFDKILFTAVITYLVIHFSAMIFVSLYNLYYDVPTESWIKWWFCFVRIQFIGGVAITIWFTLGGARDLVRLLRRLKTQEVNVRDDGSVQGRHAAE